MAVFAGVAGWGDAAAGRRDKAKRFLMKPDFPQKQSAADKDARYARIPRATKLMLYAGQNQQSSGRGP